MQRIMSASMNSKNAVAGDLFVVSGNVNGNASNNNNNNDNNNENGNHTISNSTANDMSSTSSSINANAETGNGVDVAVKEKCVDQCEKIAVKIDCRPNGDNNSSVTGPPIAPNGGQTSATVATNISKSWYARCNNRWRSQSCDRKHRNMVMRYSWNTAAMNRLA